MWESFHNDNVGLEPQPLHARRMQTRSNLLFLYPRKRPLDRVLDLARVVVLAKSNVIHCLTGKHDASVVDYGAMVQSIPDQDHNEK